jgi:hypothetical protein
VRRPGRDGEDMTVSLALACLWVVVACTLAMLPSRRNHWPQALALAAVGLPLLVYIAYENGPLIGLLALLGAASILRWPLRYLVAWVLSKVPGRARDG